MAPLLSVSNLRGSFGLLLLLALSACGGGGGDPVGSPGSSGGTGISLTPTLTPTYNGGNFFSVDVTQQICEPGPPPDFEIFTDHGATLTILANLIDPGNTSPGTLFVEKYTVEYRRSADSIGAPPILTDTRFDVIAIIPPTGTGTSTTIRGGLNFVDLTRKNKYDTDMRSGLFTSSPLARINNYTAVYTFEGKNQFGTAFQFQVQTPFQIGDFDYCP